MSSLHQQRVSINANRTMVASHSRLATCLCQAQELETSQEDYLIARVKLSPTCYCIVHGQALYNLQQNPDNVLPAILGVVV